MARGVKTGGRRKGVPNKRSQAVVEKAAANGMLPHEFLCAVSQGEMIDGHLPTFDERLEAAKAAAPYYAPKLASVDNKMSGSLTVNDGADVPPRSETYEEWHARRQRELAAVGAAAGAANGSH